jgi:hypothetical protein
VADYYALIARAVRGAGTDESRRSIYDRARTAQLTHLRKVHPPPSETEINRERLALEEAIDRVECEAIGGSQTNVTKRKPRDGQPRRAAVTTQLEFSQKVIADRPNGAWKAKSKNAVTANGFSLLSNPFVLLRVTPSSTAVEIKQAYEDAVEDEIAPADVLQRAQQSLLTPKLRIDAEVGGFLDVRAELASRIIVKLEQGAGQKELEHELASLHSLPKSNVFAHVGSQSPLGVSALFELLRAQATIAIGSACDAVIEARELAGVGRVDREAVADALARLEDRQIRGVVNALAGTSTFAPTFSAFVKRVLASEDSLLSQKLDSYVRAYNNAAASELSLRREKVVTACDALRNDPKKECAIEQITDALRRWREIGEPLQVFESHMHREEAQARELYLYVRDLCIWLANEKKQFDTARKITLACAEIFKELPRAIEQMKEEIELLVQLHNQQTAAVLLEPLVKAYEEAQENHRLLEQELLRTGFGPRSHGVVKTLYDTFAETVRSTSTTDIADRPWHLVRNVAISLNNDSRAPKAAAALINGLIQFCDVHRPSAEVVALLDGDHQACTKTAIQSDLEKRLSAGQLNTAGKLLDKLLALEKDADEVAALQKARAVLADRRRRLKNIRVGWGIAAAAVILLIVITNQDNRPTYRSSSTQTTVDGPTQLSINEDRPPIGTGVNFTRANIRYCEFQSIRLEALRSLVRSGDTLAFNALVDDWNSRCGRYHYHSSDKSAVDAETITHRSNLQSEGWAMAYTLH